MRAINYASLALLLVTSLSCSHYSPRKADHRPVTLVSRNVWLVYPLDTNDVEQGYLLEAAKIQVNEFKLDWSLANIYPSTSIVVFRSKTISCDGKVGFGGCHYDPWGPIHSIMGDRYHIPLIYHELVHHMIRDNNHTDPRWTAMWNPRQEAIANGIWASRSGLGLDSSVAGK
jgi:hypothetical protein